MADKIEKTWIDPNFGQLKERGGDATGGWQRLKKPNGLVDASETFIYNNTKYELTQTDVDALDVFLRRVTGANDVDFVRSSSGLEYIVYRKNTEIRIIDRASKKNIFSYHNIENPPFSSFESYRANNFPVFVDNCDVEGAQNFKSLYSMLYASAQTYAAKSQEYGQDLQKFKTNANPTVSDVQNLLGKIRTSNSAAATYHAAKDKFHSAKAVSRCETPDFSAFETEFQRKSDSIVSACDANAAQELRTRYSSLYQNAQIYAPLVEGYRNDVREYFKNEQPSPEQVQAFQRKKATYDQAARAYYNAKDSFYSLRATQYSESPDFSTFRREYDQKSDAVVNACDANAAQDLRARYGSLYNSAQQYESQKEVYKNNIREYLRTEQPSLAQVQALQRSKATYDQVARAYYGAKDSFYALESTQYAENPDFSAFRRKHEEKTYELNRYCEYDKIRTLDRLYSDLTSTAQIYVREVDDYRQDLRNFLRKEHDNAGDIYSLRRRQSDFDRVSSDYRNIKREFYDFCNTTSYNRCSPPPSPQPQPPGDDNTDDDPPPTNVPPVDNNTDDDPPPTTGGPAGDNNTDDDPPPM